MKNAHFQLSILFSPNAVLGLTQNHAYKVCGVSTNFFVTKTELYDLQHIELETPLVAYMLLKKGLRILQFLDPTFNSN